MDDRVGQRLGNYRVMRLIGQGGFGDVYLGEHIHLNTQAAIKVLQTRLVGNNLEQFRVEAQTIARLIHPHIVRILDFGVEEGIPFLVMDYAPNGTLRQRHPKGTPLSPANVVHYVRQAASALQYAHDRKLIHRDIKPENMLLGGNGDVLLSDFGLVLIAQSTSSQTTKEMAGTIPYMAPEQINGRPRPASDQYALGIVIYEWLSGERPFNGAFVEIATQHLMTPPAPLYGRVPGVSKAIEEVVFTALAKDPQRRFANMQAFATAYEQAHEQSRPHLPGPPHAATPLDQSLQSTYVVTHLGQPAPVTPASGQSSQSTYMVTPPRQPVLPGESLMQPRQQLQPGEVITPSNQTSWPTELVTRPDQSSMRSAGPPAPQTVANSQMSTIPVQWPANAAGAPGNAVSPAIASATPRRNGRRPLIVAGLVLLVLLIVGSAVLAVPRIAGLLQGAGPGAAGSARITITPASQDVKNTFVISAVTGTPDPSQHQVGARLLSSTTPAQSQKVSATGSKQIPAVQASGTLVITCRASSSPLTIPAGTVFTGTDGTQVATAVTVMASGCYTTVSARAVQPGASGNIPASDMNQPYSGYNINNPAAFTGGQGPQTTTIVQQSDIDGAATTLEANPPNAQRVLQGQVRTNEQMIGTPQCTPNVTSDHKAGDQAASATVTVSFNCTGEVYDRDGALSMAAKQLTTQAATRPGPGYTLVGQIVTALAQAALADASTGTIKLTVNAEGIWVFHFSAAQKLSLAKLLAGKSKKDVQSLLSARKGVSSISIQVSGGDGNTLPTDPGQIAIVVQSVSGAQATATPA